MLLQESHSGRSLANTKILSAGQSSHSSSDPQTETPQIVNYLFWVCGRLWCVFKLNLKTLYNLYIWIDLVVPATDDANVVFLFHNVSNHRFLTAFFRFSDLTEQTDLAEQLGGRDKRNPQTIWRFRSDQGLYLYFKRPLFNVRLMRLTPLNNLCRFRFFFGVNSCWRFHQVGTFAPNCTTGGLWTEQ